MKTKIVSVLIILVTNIAGTHGAFAGYISIDKHNWNKSGSMQPWSHDLYEHENSFRTQRDTSNKMRQSDDGNNKFIKTGLMFDYSDHNMLRNMNDHLTDRHRFNKTDIDAYWKPNTSDDMKDHGWGKSASWLFPAMHGGHHLFLISDLYRDIKRHGDDRRDSFHVFLEYWKDKKKGHFCDHWGSKFGHCGHDDIAPVPVPSALILFSSGLLGLVAIIRRRTSS